MNAREEILARVRAALPEEDFAFGQGHVLDVFGHSGLLPLHLHGAETQTPPP